MNCAEAYIASLVIMDIALLLCSRSLSMGTDCIRVGSIYSYLFNKLISFFKSYFSHPSMLLIISSIAIWPNTSKNGSNVVVDRGIDIWLFITSKGIDLTDRFVAMGILDTYVKSTHTHEVSINTTQQLNLLRWSGFILQPNLIGIFHLYLN